MLLRVNEAAASSETVAVKLLTALCGAQRPESILAWLRKDGVRDLLARLAAGEIPSTTRHWTGIQTARG
ncbi:hypothetical protein SAMN06272721_11376 [Arthrobacter sp. P2b]|nr:hypothetical protein SAMN06272721_11376 [Arthrobacter sp. P2b]